MAGKRGVRIARLERVFGPDSTETPDRIRQVYAAGQSPTAHERRNWGKRISLLKMRNMRCDGRQQAIMKAINGAADCLKVVQVRGREIARDRARRAPAAFRSIAAAMRQVSYAFACAANLNNRRP